VVAPGQKGFCRVRRNDKGEYKTLVHSNPCAVHIDPIEKKPLFHFLPGTSALSLATAGCNFTCKNCQNYDISQASPEDTYNYNITPGEMVQLAIEYQTPTIAYTYTEPTVFFEYMLETAKKAREKKILNIYHSNGYINRKPLLELSEYLDGANVDLKGFSEDFYEEITGGTLQPVLDTLVTLKEQGVWLEITNLVIPGVNDTDERLSAMCRWIKEELGSGIPVHFTRFSPMYKLQNIPPTPLETLRKAHGIARHAGLEYVYVGNVPGTREESTYCSKCEKPIIIRKGYNVAKMNLDGGKCKFCGTEIPGRWH
jgi:pyruvate formate lyase activating enzyme